MKKSGFISVLLLSAVLSANAQEGMWMLTQLGQLDLPKKGPFVTGKFGHAGFLLEEMGVK